MRKWRKGGKAVLGRRRKRVVSLRARKQFEEEWERYEKVTGGMLEEAWQRREKEITNTVSAALKLIEAGRLKPKTQNRMVRILNTMQTTQKNYKSGKMDLEAARSVHTSLANDLEKIIRSAGGKI